MAKPINSSEEIHDHQVLHEQDSQSDQSKSHSADDPCHQSHNEVHSPSAMEAPHGQQAIVQENEEVQAIAHEAEGGQDHPGSIPCMVRRLLKLKMNRFSSFLTIKKVRKLLEKRNVNQSTLPVLYDAFPRQPRGLDIAGLSAHFYSEDVWQLMTLMVDDRELQQVFNRIINRERKAERFRKWLKNHHQEMADFNVYLANRDSYDMG